MAEFVKVARLDELPPGSAREVVLGDQIVALFHLEDRIVAVDGICPHQGGPLAQGSCNGPVVTCPWHGWQFDLRDGRSTTFRRVRIPTFEVCVEGDDILVAVPSTDP